MNTWTNNVGSAVNTVAALGKCPVDVIRRVAGDNSAGAQCCSMTTETDADGIDRTYLNTPYFPSVEWNPTPSRCLQPKEECKRWAADTCSEWNAKTCTAYKDVCTKACGWATIPNVSNCPGWDCSKEGQKCTSGEGYVCRNGKWQLIQEVSSCPGWDCTVEGQYCTAGYVCRNKKWTASRLLLDQDDGVPFQSALRFNASALKYDKGALALFGRQQSVKLWADAVNALEAAGNTLAHAMGVAANEAASALTPAAEWVCNQTCKEECSDWSQTCKTILKGGCEAYETVGCVLNEFSPKLKCQTAQMRMEFNYDLPVRYRRTARYGKKADGHINVIPGRWTPAFGCVDKTGKAVPLENVIVGHNEQQKATEWRTKENSPNNPGAIWFNHGWGDQMGITSIGFMCPEGSHYARIGKKDMPESTSQEPAREWSSENHPGHQDNSVFLPEYRQAGMYNSMLTTGFPDMYKLCSSVDGSIESTAENKRRNIDDWGKNCGWYFEGYRRRTNTISKVDGDMSTGGAWSEIDLGVWTRDLNARDRCYDAMKNRSNEWNIRGVTNKNECENKGGTWIASGSTEAKFWGYGDICVRSCIGENAVPPGLLPTRAVPNPNHNPWHLSGGMR